MPATVEQINFHGWAALRLSNGLVEAICVPEIGGRLMQFRLGPRDFLFMNPELLGKRFSFAEHAGDGAILNWKNYGGDKTWPAPQGWQGAGQWPGPPDPVLDSGRYTSVETMDSGSASVKMTSPPDERSGLRITRQISLRESSSRLQLDLSFSNIAERKIRWSIWDVAQLACAALAGGMNDDCCLYIPIDATRQPAYEVMFGDDNAQYQLDAERSMLTVQYQGLVGKIGVHSPAGWIAFADRRAGFTLCMQFPYDADAEYPDKGATVECWTESPGAPSPIPIRSPGYILEAEVLSPLFTLQPGESASQRVTWSAAACPAPIAAVTDVGCVQQALDIDISDGWARVRGLFGCFLDGSAQLECLSASGERLHAIDLGPVSPLRVLHVDMRQRISAATRQIRLNLLDAAGARAGALASVELP